MIACHSLISQRGGFGIVHYLVFVDLSFWRQQVRIGLDVGQRICPRLQRRAVLPLWRKRQGAFGVLGD